MSQFQTSNRSGVQNLEAWIIQNYWNTIQTAFFLAVDVLAWGLGAQFYVKEIQPLNSSPVTKGHGHIYFLPWEFHQKLQTVLVREVQGLPKF